MKKILFWAVVVLGCSDFVFAQDQQQARETRTTQSGAVFTSVEYPGLGDAWSDPTGLVWGDLVRDGGSVVYMTFKKAVEHCSLRNARLPAQTDFMQLARYMQTDRGYQAQVLPRLSPYWYWTGSYSDKPNFVVLFNGRSGQFGEGPVQILDDPRSFYENAFRCVARQRNADESLK